MFNSQSSNFKYLIIRLFLCLFAFASVGVALAHENDTHVVHLPLISNGEPVYLPPEGSEDWAMVGANPQRTSWSPEEVTGNLEVEWYRPIEAYIPQNAQIITSHGMLYISTSKGLYALNAANGNLVWRFDTEMPLGNSPTVENGVVYVGGYDRKLHALNAITGAYLWSFDGAGAGYSSNPLVIDGKVFAGNRDGTMYAIGEHGTTRQGQLIWSFKAGGPILISAAYRDGALYFVAGDNHAYSLNSGTGSLRWKSDRLPGLQYQSYWPVIYQDKVIFSAASAYRKNEKPGTRSVFDHNGDRYPSLKEMQLDDIFLPNASEGSLLGPQVGSQSWSNGFPVIDASSVTEYLENNPNADPYKHKPWRRLLIALDLNNGSEYTFDSDHDGYPEYIPAAYWGAGSGNRYPGIVSHENIFYFSNLYQCCSDAKGRIMGWQPATPSLLSVTGGFAAVAEPQAISAGGDVIYRNLCCDRLGDWFDFTNPSRAGELWSYDLYQAATSYDPSWTILPGLPRLQGWYSGDSNSVNAAYHNHGDQNPIIPYGGRLYVHRSNTIFAFGPNGGAERLPTLMANNASDNVSNPTETQLKDWLELEVQKILDAGHLRPGYYNMSAFTVFGFDDYFENPGETLYTLALAYPHLPAAQQSQVRTYLQSEFNTYFNPSMYSTIGWADGAQREDVDLPPEVAQDMLNYPANINPGGGFLWRYPQYNFYAMWKYAEIFPGEAGSAYDLAKSKLEVPLPNPPIGDFFLQNPYELNGWIAGYIGFLALQEAAGMDVVDAQLRSQVENELNQIIQTRTNIFDKDSYWVEERYQKKNFDIARNFVFLVPEHGDYLRQSILNQVQEAVTEYEYIGPYWFVSRYEAALGEGVMSNLYNSNALFRAKAYILNQSQSDLIQYIDVPAFSKGDLFYLQNLIIAIEAP